ncbi:MAG: BatD family protein [Prevotella sp.]|uniref:BatD family protein n=1 Tax=Prevotella sp. TaxID=59823 RepID=UPI00258F6039|nr:BatD family protein [Prevotella sp.]MDD6854173.1 BatD family protein [Prevotella sp.]
MRLRQYILYIFLLVTTTISAQRVHCSAPRSVEVGSKFQIEYVIDASDVSAFRLGNIPEGIEILYGPNQSEVSSYQYVNGHLSGSTTVTVSYVAMATRGGNFTIPPAMVVANGRRMSTESMRVRVNGSAPAAATAQSRGGGREEKTVGNPGHGDLFILVSASKTHVHEQEPVMLTYKVYTTLNLTQLNGAMPDLKGFHTQEVKLPQQKNFHMETFRGKAYNTVTWSQYIMYPQMTGSLKIPSITYHGIVMEEDRSEDAFFTGGGYKEVPRDVTAPGITIQVDPLPAKPKDFSGGVGKFNISAQLAKTEVRAGDPINLRLVLSGTGNLKLVKEPAVQIPSDFDKYDTKITDKTKLSEAGVEGNMIYDYLFVARKEGTYTIPAIRFTYYDTGSNSYKTITTQSFTIKVDKGNGNGGMSDFDSDENKDIRPIKTGNTSVHKIGDFFFGSVAYWAIIVVLLAVFAFLFYSFRKTVLMRSDIVGMKRNNANKIATRRLRRADELMLKGKSSEFYDEVMRALWGYVSDKLNIPVEHLSSDNISEKLSTLGVDDNTINKFTGALHECEFERYAPGDTKGNMDRTMESAMTAIMEIENSLNERTKAQQHAGSGSALMLMLVAAMMLLPLSAGAITKQNADNEYAKKNYTQAIADYQELLKDGVSADIYYNLGNAYYRTDNITQALLAYERAHLLSPGDADIRFNLEMARSKTIDKITPQSEMFFVTWYKALVNLMSVDGWAYTACLSLLIAIIAMLFYLFHGNDKVRAGGFYASITFIVIFILANIFAFEQRDLLINRTGAIITSPAVTVKNGPSANAGSAFVIHEGTRVDIIDKSLANWRSIRLADGREGWITTKQLEEI